MAGEKNITLDQLKEFAARADGRLDALEAGTPVRQVLTLDSGEWTDDSGDAEFPYQYRLAVAGVTAASVANAVLDDASAELAYEYGLSSVTDTDTDTVIFRSRTAPDTALTGVMDIIFKPWNSGS